MRPQAHPRLRGQLAEVQLALALVDGHAGREAAQRRGGRILRDLPRDDVHFRRADEGGDELGGRLVVKGVRSVHLDEDALVEHGDTIAHRHRLDLVMGHVDGGDLELLLQPDQLHPHLHAQ